MTKVRRLQEEDWPHVWQFMEPVIRVGQTYPFAMDMTSEEAHMMWIEVTECAYVAEDAAGQIVGSYYIKPNQPTLGAHVANCGFVVAKDARGHGVATTMGEHSLTEAKKLGYRAMQFNLVVATNAASLQVWKKLGFDLVGTLPGAFNHRDLGYVDACVFYKELV